MKKILKKIKRNRRYLFFFIVIAIIYVGVLIIFKQYDIKQEDIKKLIEPLGAYGFLGLFIIQVIFSLTPLPDGMMPIIATIMYGWPGLIIIILGMLTATAIHYFIARKLGSSLIERRYPKIKKYVDLVKGKHVIFKLIYIRIFTLVSFDLDAYVAGIAKIDFKTFMIASIIGIIPTNAIMMLISQGLFAESVLDLLNIGFWVVISFTVLAILYKKSKISLSN